MTQHESSVWKCQDCNALFAADETETSEIGGVFCPQCGAICKQQPNTTEREPDVTVENHGTLFLFRLHTDAAHEWVDGNIAVPEYMRFGGHLAVEHRYARDIAQGMLDAGLEVK